MDRAEHGPEVERTLATQPLPVSAPEDLVLDRYRLDRRLGEGGFGVVWLARDERLERDVALKVIPHGDDVRGAEREALAAARLNHPGIVALYELGSDEEAAYIVSELVRGRTFGELRRAGALSDRDVALVGAALCDALAHAHGRGVIHRDVKPGNVMVLSEPAAGAGFAKLADFGVAHLAGGEPTTRTGDVVGTLAYMAPEQAEGERVTAAADVYSLALTLYEGWTGSNPVRGRSPAATARRLGNPLPPLGRIRRDLPGGLCAEIDAALDPEPGHRPTPAELGEVLSHFEGELSDEGGLVEPGTIERMGLEPAEGRPRAALQPGRLVQRAVAALAAGGIAAAAVVIAPGDSPTSPSLVGAVVALLVALVPRIGWLVAAAGAVAFVASPGVDQPGAALVIGCALLVVPVLLPRSGVLWFIPALAPLLAWAGIGPAYIVVAALAGSIEPPPRRSALDEPPPTRARRALAAAWRRAALGAAGALWVAAAEALSGKSLLAGMPDDVGQVADWGSSAARAAEEVVGPWTTSAAPAALVAWALLAVLLPVLVRGRSLGLDLAGGAVWGAACVVAHKAIGELAGASLALPEPRGVLLGAIGGVIVAAVAGAMGLIGPPSPAWRDATNP